MKVYGAIRTAMYWILTALVIAFVSTLAQIEVLRYFIGGLMIFYGIEEIIYTVFKNKKHYSIRSLYWNIVEIVIGITLVVFVETGNVEVTYAVVCVCWAIWSILREAHELVEATEKLKDNKLLLCRIVAIVNFLESFTVIALSLTMLIEPSEHHAKIHLYLLVAELFTKVLFPLVNYIALRLEEKKELKAVNITVETPHNESAEEEVAVSDGGEFADHGAIDVSDEEQPIAGATEEEPTEELTK